MSHEREFAVNRAPMQGARLSGKGGGAIPDKSNASRILIVHSNTTVGITPYYCRMSERVLVPFLLYFISTIVIITVACHSGSTGSKVNS